MPVGLADEDFTCDENEDCPTSPFKICVEGVCKHKSIFPMYPSEFFGILVLPALLALANVGGIGGGGLIIPITMALFSFTTKQAIAISGFTILTGSVTRFLLQLNEKHPEKNATVIDYGIVIVMMPMVLVGSFVGVLVNVMLPGVVLSLILFILLVFLAWKSLHKAFEIYHKESQQL